MFSPAIIVPSFVVAVLGFVFFLQQAKEAARPLGSIIKIVLCVLLLSSFSFLQLLSPMFKSFTGFVFLQIIYFLSGLLYAQLFSKNIFGSFDSNERLSKFIVLIHCIVVIALSYAIFVLVYNFIEGQESFGNIIGLSLFTFIIPSLFIVCFKYLLDIPAPIFSVWYCPAEPEEIDYEILENSKILILDLEYTLTPSNENPQITKVRAPVRMTFQQWFTKFIFDYNEKYYDKQLVVNNEQNQPYGWMFYTKPSFFKKKKYIDPESVIKDNFFPDNVVIVAKRLTVYEQK